MYILNLSELAFHLFTRADTFIRIRTHTYTHTHTHTQWNITQP